MKFTFILLAFIFSFGAWAQNPCTPSNVNKLLGGYPTDFYSRAQANECLKKSAIATEDKNTFGFQTPEGIRYLKKNKNDFFIGKTLLGKYKITDRTADGNKSMMKAKFIPKECLDPTPQTCEAKNQDFDKENCVCVTKDAVFCGDKKWSVEKRDKAQISCAKREDYSWNDANCECSKELFCGDKKWSKNKKEQAAESCLDKSGYEWNDESCSCQENSGYCGDKKWTLKQLEKEENSCSKLQKWNPETCACEGDDTKRSCHGKVVNLIEWNQKKLECDSKSSTTVRYTFNEEDCSCDQEKNHRSCGGEEIGVNKYERQKRKCEERIAQDSRWTWVEDETSCDCMKIKESKLVPTCDGKRISEQRLNRKIKRCQNVQGEWDPQSCKCKDPCYDDVVEPKEDIDTCTDNFPKLGDVVVADLAAKVCEKAIPDTEKEKIKAQCQKEVEDIFNQSPDKAGLKTIAIKIKYTSDAKVLCGENIVTVKNNQDFDHALPANVPTTDPAAFEGDCEKAGGAKLNSTLSKYRPYGKISCTQLASITKANDDIIKMVNESFDKFFKDLGIEGKISPEEMDKVLANSNFDLQVIGTANRSNNGTGITLEDLALKRKQEAERIIRAELTKKLQSKVNSDKYTVPNGESLFTYNGISQAVGPLNPAATWQSMQVVLNEKGVPGELQQCASKNGAVIKNTKTMYDCSVDYFVDKECPNLAGDLQAKFCDGDKEALRVKLKAEKTGEFLSEYKMFQVGLGMSSESKTPTYADVGTIEIDCNAPVESIGVTETTTNVSEMLKVTKPGFFRRLKKDCREERKALNEKYGKKNVRKAANQKKNPNGIVINESSSTSVEE